jgi:GDP-4-dehydro-6-deoxy-D-mannose reductase
VSAVAGSRALVTGAAGFVGRYLVGALTHRGWNVTGAALAPVAELCDPGAQWVYGDLRDPAHVEDALRVAQPDLVIHLAGISHLPTAAQDPVMAWDVNVTATVRLLHALAQAHTVGRLAPRVLVIGSAEQYGRHEEPAVRLTEAHPLAPRTVYAATKMAQEVAALQTWRATGLPVIAVRSFNHSGAGQSPHFLLPALVARALALRDAPAGTPLVLGNSTPIRDFLHVRDVVDAYIALGQHGESGTVYNVASGVGRSVREVAERILARVGLDAPLYEDPALRRPVDVPSLVGDPTRMASVTGWRPTRTFDDLLDDLLHAATH